MHIEYAYWMDPIEYGLTPVPPPIPPTTTICDPSNTVNPEISARILFSQVALKDMLAMSKIHN